MNTSLHSVLADPVRLKALTDTHLLDTPAETTFDRLTRLAARGVQAPVALVSLVTDQRQFFKSHVGLPEPVATTRETPLSHSFCQYTVASGIPLVVSDARMHPVLQDNPAIPDLDIIAYAGFPIQTPSGAIIGTLCAIDQTPREWEADDLALLADLAALVSNEIARRETTFTLQRTTAQLSALLNQRSEMIWTVDRDLRLVLFNTTYAERLNYFFGVQAEVGLAFEQRFTPARATLWRDCYTCAFTGERFSIEEAVQTRDGTFWHETTFCPIVTDDGKIEEVSVFSRDVTATRQLVAEHAHMLAAAQQAHEQTNAILERIHDAFFALDSQWNFTYVNRHAEQILQQSAEKLIGQNFWSIYPDALHNPIITQYQTNIERYEPVFFEAYYAPAQVWLDVRIYPSHDGVSVYVHDLTARHYLEAQNRIQARALDAIMQAVLVISFDEKVIYQNAAAVALFDPLPEIDPRSAYALIAPHSHAAATQMITQASEGQAQQIGLDLVRRDGTIFPALVTVAPINHEDGTPPQIVVVITDLTEQSHAEEERLRMERDLLESQRLESLGLLAGGVAHDFNNLLMVIMGHANLARTELNAPNQIALHLDEIVQVTRRAADLTRQMLAYAGKERILLEPVDLSLVIHEMVTLIRASLPTPLPVLYDLDTNLPLIEADAAQIRQVVLNLVLNAAEATPLAGGRITVRTTTSHHPRPVVVLEVRDTGSGIPPELHERIFDPFFTTKFTGRGLGLAAVQGVVRQHDGTISLESSPGQGSCFRVTFPIPPEPLQAITEQPSAKTEYPATTVPATMLVVDDETAVRSITERMLRRWGYTVFSAESGAAAIAWLHANPTPLDVALIDWTMPGIHGVALIEELLALRPHLQIVVMSGYTEASLRSELAQDLRVAFLHKPFGADQLRAVLAQMAC